MANTLTDLIPDIYASLDVISRELTGMIAAVTIDASVARAAVGQDVRSPVVPAAQPRDIVPGNVSPPAVAQTIGNKFIRITKERQVPFTWNGEEQRGLNSGPGYESIRGNQFTQAFRALSNEVEIDLTSLSFKMSRAEGTGGVTPFASDLSDPANVRKILVDNGAPVGDMQLVIDTTAGAKMRSLAQLSNVNESGDQTLLRQGVLLPLHAMDVRESGQIKTQIAGTAVGATTDAAGYAVGATVVTLAAAGTGAIVVGDAISFAGDSEKYIVAAGDADVSGGGTTTITAPGLRSAIPAAATAITLEPDYVANMAFSRSAIILATRLPERPQEGDMASDVAVVTDPRSGLSFEIAQYGQYRQVQYEVSIVWGFEHIKSEHSAILLG